MVILWQKLSGSINFYIRDICKDKILKSNEELLDEYLSYFDDGNGNLEYLDKSSFKYIKLTDENIERVKKKVKYADEIKEKASRLLAKVIEFPKR